MDLGWVFTPPHVISGAMLGSCRYFAVFLQRGRHVVGTLGLASRCFFLAVWGDSFDDARSAG